MGRDGSVIRLRNWRLRGRGLECIPPVPIGNFGHFLYPALQVSSGGDTISRWSLLSAVYARGSKISHTEGKCVACRGLHILPGQKCLHDADQKERKRLCKGDKLKKNWIETYRIRPNKRTCSNNRTPPFFFFFFLDPVIIISGPSHATFFGSSVLHPG